ncbi:MAG TPA: hypothetical protein PK525_12995 [Anaerohalosphaeraceae bacterium]|nr:hypothetical protein [Anaerohalosphaeraceae bacterium]HRT24790.1 hypothetical protein [Anaerohalosphaeraceae bacterium]HRV21339.1 hypothetical protein [Anaerohalosphaeraceae bacterium]
MKTAQYKMGFIGVVLVCGTCFAARTYVDTRGGAGGNTVNAVTGSPTDWWVSSPSQDNLWGRRSGFANNPNFTLGGDSDVFESSGTGSGRENSPMVKTVLSGLQAGMYYNLWVVYWSANGQNWCIRAGLTPANLPLYDFTGATGATAGTRTGKTEGDRNELTASLGYAAADSSGTLSVYVDDKPSDASQGGWYDRTWYDGILYEVYNIPFAPSPADGAVNVALSTSVLSFMPMRDPNNLSRENPKILLHKVYFDDDPNMADAEDLLASLPAGLSQTAMPALQNNKTYYWRVDELLKDNTVIAGIVWSFQTVKTVPDFNPPIGYQPVSTAIFPGETAVLSAAAGAGDFNYQWYKGTSGDTSQPLSDEAEHIWGASSSQLSIRALPADEGLYWCRAGNELGTADSQAAGVTVKRLTAHWTLNLSDYHDGRYEDITGEGHPVIVQGSPVFFEGVDGQAAGAVQIDSANGFGNSGTWNPSAISGRLTISLWAWWAGPTDPVSWQGLMAKRNAFTEEGMMWQLEVDQSNNNVVYKNGSNQAVSSDPLPIGQWAHVAVTFDGTTVSLYRNGELVSSGVVPFSGGTAANLVLGATELSDADVFSWPFHGGLDDVRIYNYALDAAAVAHLYVDFVPDASICLGNPEMDFSGPLGEPDCRVDLYDLAALARQWLVCRLIPSSACY